MNIRCVNVVLLDVTLSKFFLLFLFIFLKVTSSFPSYPSIIPEVTLPHWGSNRDLFKCMSVNYTLWPYIVFRCGVQCLHISTFGNLTDYIVGKRTVCSYINSKCCLRSIFQYVFALTCPFLTVRCLTVTGLMKCFLTSRTFKTTHVKKQTRWFVAEIGYCLRFSVFSSVPPAKCRNSTLNYVMTTTFHILSDSLFINHHINRRYVFATDRLVK